MASLAAQIAGNTKAVTHSFGNPIVTQSKAPTIAPVPKSSGLSLGRVLNDIKSGVVNTAASTGKAASLTGQGVVNLERLGIAKASGTKYQPVQKQTPILQKTGAGANPSLHQYIGAAIQTGALGLGGISKGGSLAVNALKTGAKLAPAGTAFGAGSAIQAGEKPGQIVKSAAIGALSTATLGAGGSALGEAIAKARAVKAMLPNSPPSAIDKLIPPEENITKVQKTKSTVPAMQNIPVKDVPRLTTEIAKAPSSFKRAVTSTSGVLSNLGDSGKEIANRLDRAENISEVGQAKFLNKIPSVTKLKGDKFKSFVQGLDDLSGAAKQGSEAESNKLAQIKAQSPEIHRAIQEWTRAIPTIRQEAVKTGMQVGDLGKYYFPRNYSEILKTRNGFNQAAQHLIDSGQAKDVPAAIKLLTVMKSKYSSPFGHFENARSNVQIPGYDTSRNALTSYVSGAFNKIGHAAQFGPKGEAANRLLANIAAEGKDANLATKYYQTAVGTVEHPPIRESVTRNIMAYNRITKLGLSSILNATQSNNTFATAGIFNTARAALKTLSPADRAYVDKTGTTVESVINNLKEQGGLSGKSKGALNKVLNAPGFGAVEKFNRRVASIAGRDWANRLASKGDARSLNILKNKLGVEGDIGKSLTEPQQIQASRALTKLTQFKTGAKDLPAWTQSPEGKLVAQFRTFAYKQTGFVYNELIKEALRGNGLPLLRFIAVGTPIGIAAGGIRNVLGGKPFYGDTKGQSTANKLLGATYQGSSNVGGTGLLGNAIFLGQNAKSPNIASYVAGDVGGPSVGLGASLIQAGNNKTKLERLGLGQVPVGGSYLKSKLTPFGSAQQRSFDSIANNSIAKALVQAGYNPTDPSDARSKNLKTTDPKQYQQFLDRSNKTFVQKIQNYLNSSNYKQDSPDIRKRTLSNALSQARQKTLYDMQVKYAPKVKTPLVKSY